MKMFKAILSAVIGNALEVYDMIVYSLLAPAIAGHFFPRQAKLTGIANVFAIFLLVISHVL